MKLFDLHCDTLWETYHNNQNPHISFDKIKIYDVYTQIFAIYSDNKLSDEEAYQEFHEIINYYKSFINTFPQNFKYYLAVEGANILAGDITRLDVLYEFGIRFLTLVWAGVSCIGGAHRTDIGLTEFGKLTVNRCFELGVVPDLSHSSEHLFWDTVNIADEYNKPVIATHSNSRAICKHSRTITDEMFNAIKNRNGLVGINLYSRHLSDTDICNIDTVISHIEHFMSLGGENTVCMGCDFDGANEFPEGISDISDLHKIYDRLLSLNYSAELADNIFYNNAKNFMLRNEL
jgi:Zn-dependent dipeptidase, microsomal dipeptidase homolog